MAAGASAEFHALGTHADRAAPGRGRRAQAKRPSQDFQSAVFADDAGQGVDLGTADELGDADVLRVFVDLGGRADLNDVSLDHDGDAARHRHRLGLVMGDVDKRGFQLAMQLGELGAHMHAQLGVQVGQRLVEQKPERLAHDGASDRNALPLAA